MITRFKLWLLRQHIDSLCNECAAIDDALEHMPRRRQEIMREIAQANIKRIVMEGEAIR